MSYNLPYNGDVVEAAIKRVIEKLSDPTKGLSTNDYADADKIKVDRLESVYVLKDGIDITVEDNVVTKLLRSDFSGYGAIAFPEGITEINLGVGDHGQPFIANKVIMPKSLKTIGRDCFGNYVKWDNEDNLIEDTIIVKVKEYVLNEGLETIGSYAFADNIYLGKVNIPESIQVINRGAFEYCDSLKGIFIPATVTKIGDGNFTTTTFKAEDSTTIYGYAGSEAERYAINENWLKEYVNPFVNMGSDYSAELENKVTKEDGKGLSTNDFTNQEKEKLAGLENYEDAKLKDEVNYKMYGTTDVHILTDDDIWITEDGIFEAQKRPVIEYDVVIIPYGVKTIFPRYPDTDNGGSLFYPEGIYPIYIKAKKIIFPSTLINIYGSPNLSTSEFDVNIDGECVLNEGVEIINLINGTNASGASFGKVTIPKTLKTFTVWGYYQDIIIPKSVNKFSFWSADELDCNLYVYNPVFDFSSFEVGQVEHPGGDEPDGVIHGYAGSTAEAFAKENGYNFVNMGSDYSEQLGDIESALDHILELDNALLGGDAL